MAIDISLVVIWGLVTWCVAGEGAFGAAVSCLCSIIAGLVAMTFFEPFATFGQNYLIAGWAAYWDVIALTGIFAVVVTGLRLLADYLVRKSVDLGGLPEEIGRWVCGAVNGYMLMAFLLTALHTAPLPREFMGFTPERRNLFNVMAPDRQWLGLTQFVSEHVFAVSGQPRIFDGPVASVLQGVQDPPPNTVWPSFPIRYATRRAQFSGEVFAAPQPIQQPVQQQPGGKNSGGAAGF